MNANTRRGNNQYKADRRGRLATIPSPQFALLAQGEQLSMLELWDRKGVAAGPTATPEMLGRLSTDPDWEVREAVASNPACPPDTLMALSKDPQLVVRQVVAENRNCPAGLLNMICVQAEQQTRWAVNHPREAPPGTVQTLVHTCAAVAGNPNSSPGLLVHLSAHGHPMVRQQVARHPACPVPALQRMASDPDPRVRRQVVLHPACPARTVAVLQGDHDATVLEAVRYRQQRTVVA
jgi:hypothetical protein